MKKMILASLVLFALAVGSVSAEPICPEGTHLSEGPEAYANAVASTSGTVGDPSDALGIPDGNYANIYPTVPFSSITLDMGAGEEIWNTNGNDFSIRFGEWQIDPSNTVEVYVSDSPTSGFELVDTSTGLGPRNYDFGSTSYNKIRYVRIVNTATPDGETKVEYTRGYCLADKPSNNVPEFTAIGAGLALLGAGLVAYKKRK